MKRSRITETQIVSILKEADVGAKVKDQCRKHGISDATSYNWRSKCGGVEASDLKRMKQLEGELSQYERICRAYGRMKLNHRRQAKRRLPKRHRVPL